MAEIYRARLYADDGTTVAAEFSTDPTHPYPYLSEPGSFAPQEISFAEGRARIGSLNISIVDVPTDPNDPDTGFITALLADAMGRRFKLEILVDSLYENVIDGPIDNLTLGEGYSSYDFSIKDQRENERRLTAFTQGRTSSVLPRGVIGGFATSQDGSVQLVPPTAPLTATVESWATFFDPTIFGDVRLFSFANVVGNPPNPPADRVVTDKMMKAFALDQNNRCSSIRVLWRVAGESVSFKDINEGAVATGLYGVIEAPYWIPTAPGPVGLVDGVYKNGNQQTTVRFIGTFSWFVESGVDAPPIGSSVEVIFGFNGETSEDYPLHYEGTFGEFWRLLKNGFYSPDYVAGQAPLVEYDDAVLATFTEPCIVRITKPLDDDDGVWKAIETEICAPLGAAPALDSRGRVSPIRYALPDEEAELVQLDDTNCEPIPGWQHTGSDAINIVSVEYQRLYRLPADVDPLAEASSGDSLAVRNIIVEHRNADSIEFFGERPLRIKASTICAIGGEQGEALTGDVANEFGAQLADKRNHEAMDRFVMGGIHSSMRANRSLTGTIRVGQFVVDARSWAPDYNTGLRGASRLAQIVRVLPINSGWYELEIVDAGNDAAPVGQPTLGAATVTEDGAIAIPVTAIAAGSEARVEYILSDEEPSQSDPGWRYIDRIAAPGIVTSPPLPAGSLAWYHARGEKEGRRPSQFTAPVSIEITATPRVRRAKVVLSKLGVPTLTYSKNQYVAGVRVYYSIHLARTAPTYTTYFDFAATGSHVLDLKVRAGEVLDVAIDAYSGFEDDAVTGTRGDRSFAQAAFPANQSSNALSRFGKIRQNKDTVTVGGIPGALVDLVFVYVKDYDVPSGDAEDVLPEVDPLDVPTAILDAATGTDIRGYLTYTANRPEITVERYVFFIPVDADGEEGRTEVIRIDSKASALPYFDKWSMTGLLTVAVIGRINDPENMGGTLSVWLPTHDFSGDPDGTIEITAAQMPYTFGPSTVFAPSSAHLLSDVPAPPNDPSELGFRFDTTDGRTTGLVTKTVKTSLDQLIDEYGALRVSSWQNALAIASGTEGIGVGDTLPPDGSVYTDWYRPSDNTVYHWTGSAWEAQEGTGHMVFGTAIGGSLVVGAVNAEAVSTDVFIARAAEIKQATVDRLIFEGGGLDLLADNLGAQVRGSLIARADPDDPDSDLIAQITLENAGTSEYVIWTEKFSVDGMGNLHIAELDGTTGTFAGEITAATAKFFGAAHLRSGLYFDADVFGEPDTVVASILATGKGGQQQLGLYAGTDADTQARVNLLEATDTLPSQVVCLADETSIVGDARVTNINKIIVGLTFDSSDIRLAAAESPPAGAKIVYYVDA